MNKKLNKEEFESALKILQLFPNIKDFFQETINNIEQDFVKIEKDQYNQEFFAEFMKKYLTQIFIKHKSEIQNSLKNAHQNIDKFEEDIAKVGSIGITSLIKDYLNKIGNKNSISKEDIIILRDLVNCRNSMQIAEKEYIEKNYKEYLQKQILLFSNRKQ